jgi:hypothetical protein
MIKIHSNVISTVLEVRGSYKTGKAVGSGPRLGVSCCSYEAIYRDVHMPYLEESEIHNNRQSTKFLALPSDELLVEQFRSNYAFQLLKCDHRA